MAMTGTTPNNTSDHCTGRLASKITSTQTTGITITADTITTPAGTAPVTFPTGEMLLKVSRKTRTKNQIEIIGVESASQSGATVTLGTCNRYMSQTDGGLWTSVSSTGIAFPAGSIVELTWTTHHAENTAFKNNVNAFTLANSFAGLITSTAGISMSGTSSYLKVPNLTTAQRTALTASNGMIVYDSDIGVHYQYIGGAWSSFATGTVSNAADNTAGKVDLASTTELAALTATDAMSGAPNVVPVSSCSITTATSGKVPVLNTSGLLDVAIGGTGKASPSTGTLLIGAGTSAMTTIGPGSNGQVPVSNGTTIAMGSAPAKTKNIGGATLAYNADVKASFTSEAAFTNTLTVPASTLATIGDRLKIRAWGSHAKTGSPTFTVRLKVGGSTIYTTSYTATGTGVWDIEAFLTVLTTGASGSMTGVMKGTTTAPAASATTYGFVLADATSATILTGLDMTGSIAITVTAQSDASSPSNIVTLQHLSAEAIVSTAL